MPPDGRAMRVKMKKLLCDVYRSLKKDEAYLYVEQKTGLKDLPEALLEVFGPAEKTLTLILTEDKKLARAEAAKVMADIEEQLGNHGLSLVRRRQGLELAAKEK